MTEGVTTSDALCPSRRALFAGLGVTGLVTVLGACSSRDTGSSGTGSDPATSNPAPTTGGATSGGAGGALAKTSDVPVGSGVVAGGVLITQLTAGEFKAYSASCPHQGVTVDAPKNGKIICQGHGSAFNAKDGSLLNGPATKGLTPVAVKVSGDSIVKA